MRGDFDQADLTAIARALPLDAWIINRFSVLPTDERFQALTDATKALLFEMCNATATADEVLKWYRRESAITKNAEDEAVKKRASEIGIDLIGALEAIRTR